MAAKRGKRGSDRWASEAALQSLVRFGPEQSGLKELERQLKSNYETGVRQARGNAAGIVSAVDEVRPQVADMYDQAGLDQARTGETLIGHDLAGLGAVADSIKAGSALEVAAQLGNLQKARSSALTDLSSRKVAATEGEAFATQNALHELTTGLERLFQRKQDLGREKGAFETLTQQQLQDAARERGLRIRLNEADNSQSERNSVRSAGIDPDTGLPIPGGKLDPKAKPNKPRQTPDKHFETAQSINDMAAYVERWKGQLTRAEIAKKLQKGRPQQTIKVDPDTGKKLPVPKVLEPIPRFKADLRMTAALDVALDGHLSRATERKLRRAGFRLSDLALPTYGQWRRKQADTPAAAAKQTARQLGAGLGGLDFSLDGR